MTLELASLAGRLTHVGTILTTMIRAIGPWMTRSARTSDGKKSPMSGRFFRPMSSGMTRTGTDSDYIGHPDHAHTTADRRPNMLRPSQQVKKVRRLLAAGWSLRKIAC